MTRSLLKDTFRSIRKTFSRFVAIAAIIALGVSLFIGIKATGPDLIKTAEGYFSDDRLMDLRVQSSIGLDENDIASLRAVTGVESVMPVKFADALVKVNGEAENDIDGTRISTRLYSLDPELLGGRLGGSDKASFLNFPELVSGRYPSSAGECVVDASALSTPESYQPGNVISVELEDSDISAVLNTTEFVIVGVIRTPYYLSFERGNTNVGSGKLGTFIYVPLENFKADYYTEAYIRIAGSDSFDPYSEEYTEFISQYASSVRELANERVAFRVSELARSLPELIRSGEAAIESARAGADSQLSELVETIDTLRNLVANGQTMIAQAQAEIDAKFGQAQDQLDSSSAAYQNAIATYQSNYNTWLANKSLYESKMAEWNTQSANLAAKQQEYNLKKAQYDQAESTLNATKDLFEQSRSVLAQLQQMQQNSLRNEDLSSVLGVIQVLYPDLFSSISGLTSTGMVSYAIATITPMLDGYAAQIASQEQDLENARTALKTAEVELSAAQVALNAAKDELDANKAALDSAEATLNSVYSQITGQSTQLSSGRLELALEKIQAESQLNTLKSEVANAPANLEKAETAYNEALESLNNGISQISEQVAAAEATYNMLPNAKWYVYDRDDTPGYRSLETTAQNMEALADIFPVFFFLVAAFVCLSTMNRMVKDDRGAIGTYRALGYGTLAIASKYIIYSAVAGFIGSAVGMAGGMFLFPWAISTAYSVMYTIPPLRYSLPMVPSVLSVVVSFICTVGAAAYSASTELRSSPAALMRPKAPKPGKRVLLERAGALWSRMSFSSKVTVRNLMRNKKRLIMTVVGIAGCMSLMLASIGTFYSISSLMDDQFGEDGISMYDVTFVFTSPVKLDDPSPDFIAMTEDSRISSLMLTSMKSVTGRSDHSKKTEDVYLFVPENASALNVFINLRDADTGARVELNDSGAVITEKYASDMGVSVGESVTVELPDGNTYSIPVAAVVENYTFHYIYMSQALYERIVGAKAEFSYAVAKLDPVLSGTDGVASLRSDIASEYLKGETVGGVSYTADTVRSFNEIIRIVNIVVIIFILAAAALSIIILYNLSNISLLERYRELASLKVLGFSDREVNRYIFRENNIMTFIGIAAGAYIGTVLHRMIMVYAEVDAVMFSREIPWWSYPASILLTIIFSLISELIMSRKMKEINMAESLKSVE
ncbi:MAG: FtsX-like permease family protein [Clostridia bacterium]|nr:FtsX-like permease family protein [Clostridia bacterium]